MNDMILARSPAPSVPVSARRQALAEVARDIEALDDQLDAAGRGQLRDAAVDVDDASRALEHAADRFVSAAAHGLGGAFNATFAVGHGAAAVGHTASGTGLVVGAGAVEAAEESVDALGWAGQLLGRWLIGAGNEAREVAGVGGDTLEVRARPGDPSAPLLSDALRDAGVREYQKAGDEAQAAISHALGAVANGVLGGVELTRAAGATARAAGETLAAAKDLADAGAIEVCERAVELAGLTVKVVDRAVQAGEEGVDAAGRALQAAGRALVAAGNAVNTARAEDTAVR